MDQFVSYFWDIMNYQKTGKISNTLMFSSYIYFYANAHQYKAQKELISKNNKVQALGMETSTIFDCILVLHPEA